MGLVICMRVGHGGRWVLTGGQATMTGSLSVSCGAGRMRNAFTACAKWRYTAHLREGLPPHSCPCSLVPSEICP